MGAATEPRRPPSNFGSCVGAANFQIYGSCVEFGAARWEFDKFFQILRAAKLF